jgi:hypothetical protein
MMAKLTPLQHLKNEHGSKSDLIDKLAGKLETFEDESSDDFRARLAKVSNKKLLRLYKAYTRIETEFGDKATLVDAVIKLKRPHQAKDLDYKNKLQQYQVTRLLDLHDSGRRSASKS